MTAIAVCGPHRSGTSAVAGVLYHLGIHMGDDLIGPGHGNPTGHFEDCRFVELHDKIIGNWKDPRVDFEPHRELYTALIREREARFDLWGIKDPRMCFVFPYFAEIARDVCLIAVERDPDACVDSLVARGGHTWVEAHEITWRYLIQLRVRCWGSLSPMLSVRYEHLVDRPEGVIMAIAAFVGAEPTDEAIAFIDPGLRHHGGGHEERSEFVARNGETAAK